LSKPGAVSVGPWHWKQFDANKRPGGLIAPSPSTLLACISAQAAKARMKYRPRHAPKYPLCSRARPIRKNLYSYKIKLRLMGSACIDADQNPGDPTDQ
jgi:hypothetical protein